MNPTLLQHHYNLDYPVSADNRYISQDRPFTISGLASSHYGARRNNQGNTSLGQTLPMSTNNDGLDENPQQVLAYPSYHSGSHLLLSPPSSIEGSTVSVSNSASSSYLYSNVPKLSSSEVNPAEPYSSTSGSFVQSAWSGPSMNDYAIRSRVPQLPQTLSPPVSYSMHYPHHKPATLEPYNNYVRPLIGTTESLLGRPRAPLSHPYHIQHMAQASQPRPEGPPFEDTKILYHLIGSRNQALEPGISATIQKGFFQVEGKWTCYRRNYFTVSCAFSFRSPPIDHQVYLQRHPQSEQVLQYAVSISAKTASVNNQESESRALVQHTPKRDKATETVPGRHLIQPAQTPILLTSSTGMSHPGLYHGHHSLPGAMLAAFDAYPGSAPPSIPACYTFERIQFQKATANNGKRRAQQQYFHVVVELSVNVGRHGGAEDWVVVATKQSHPMVVRGRSPGHYKDNARRDSQTSMDPDHEYGSGGDVPVGRHTAPSLMGSNGSSMDWAPSHSRHGHNYSTRYAHSGDDSTSSPTSAEFLTPVTGPSGDEDYQLAPISTLGLPKNDVFAPPNGSSHYVLGDGGMRTDLTQPLKMDGLHGGDGAGRTSFGTALMAEGGPSPPLFDYIRKSRPHTLCAT